MHKIDSKNRIHQLPVKSKLEALRDTLHKLNHDVRTPITGIIDLATLLIDEEKDEIEVRSNDLKMIKESAETIIDIIDGVLDESINDKYEGAKSTASIDIKAVMDKVKRLYSPIAYKKGHLLILNNNINSNSKVSAYTAAKLVQILGNLVSIALEFTPENKNIDVTIATGSAENQIKLSVAVNVEESEFTAEQIMERTITNNWPLSSNSSVAKRGNKGCKLGHIKKLLSDEKGTIAIHSDEKLGTQLDILMPLHFEIDSTKNALNLSNGRLNVG